MRWIACLIVGVILVTALAPEPMAAEPVPSLEKALAAAEYQGKLVLLEFFTDW